MVPNRTRHGHTVSFAVATIACAALAIGSAPAHEAAGQPATPILPLRLTAAALGLGSLNPGTTAKLEIDIIRWSTAREREHLVATLADSGPDALLSVLKQMPFHGHMSIPRWFGPDPHNARLGWDLRYASSTPLDQGGRRIAIATERFVGFWETRDAPASLEYPFTLIEIHLDKHQRGTGKMSVAAKIAIDRTTGQLQLENYASEPVRLTDVKIER